MGGGPQIEREVKLGVWPGFHLPELDSVVEGLHVLAGDECDLHASYHDTPDLRLARSGVTLRHRSGEGWTLKVPTPEGEGHDQGGGVLSRREHTVEGDEQTVPAELAGLVTAWVRTSALSPVARLQTRRRSVALVDAMGVVAVEVVDDEVSVLHGQHLALRFREVEVELGGRADPGLLEVVVSHLRAAGAGPADPTPKVMRALGPRSSEPAELVDTGSGGSESAANVIRAGLRSSVRRLLAHDVGVRLGEDPEAVHQARVATRRLRSDLRTFAPLLDEDWAAALRAELKWIAAALGEVRDADVLLAGLQAGVADLDLVDSAPAALLLDRLHAQRAEARQRLLAALGDHRYAAVLDRLVTSFDAHQPEHVPAVPHGAPAAIISARGWLLPEADAPAVEVFPLLVRKPWKHLRRAVDAVEPGGPDEELHQVRIRAKRCRYAAEVAALAVGKAAKRFASAVADVQEVLGEHQDAVVAEAWLRSVVPELPPAEALVAGQLIAAQRALAGRTRRTWDDAWNEARRPKLRAWLGE